MLGGSLKKIIVAGALIVAAQSVSAATYTYDFKATANSGGGIGESIFSTFNTSNSGGVFAGFTRLCGILCPGAFCYTMGKRSSNMMAS